MLKYTKSKIKTNDILGKLFVHAALMKKQLSGCEANLSAYLSEKAQHTLSM
jgi:hypothetical protein